MSLQSLYRRYRPQKFSEVVGQSHVVNALKNAAASGRVGQVYLFSGPRGTGKTSTARILAKALNCEKPKDGEPCGKCSTCKEIEAGTAFDLIELDAASNNGVDAIRDLISMVATTAIGNYKVYVIDEVHMLSSGAENALLKTLEEPPNHVIFVMATTEPHKVVDTVKSRAQHLEFGLIDKDELKKHLEWVIEDAKIKVSDKDLEYVLKTGAGSARDALSALDQVAAAGSAPDRQVESVNLVEGIIERDTKSCLEAVQDSISGGGDLRVMLRQTIEILRNAFLISSGVEPDGISSEEKEIAASVSKRMKIPSIVNAMEALGDCIVEMRSSPDQRIDLEIALVKLTRTKEAELHKSLERILDMIEEFQVDVENVGKINKTAPAEKTDKKDAAKEKEKKEKVVKDEKPVQKEAPKKEVAKKETKKEVAEKEPAQEKPAEKSEDSEPIKSRSTLGANRRAKEDEPTKKSSPKDTKAKSTTKAKDTSKTKNTVKTKDTAETEDPISEEIDPQDLKEAVDLEDTDSNLFSENV